MQSQEISKASLLKKTKTKQKRKEKIVHRSNGWNMKITKSSEADYYDFIEVNLLLGIRNAHWP